MNVNLLPKNERVYICGHLARKERRIQYVFHGTDGEISMLCGWDDCDVEDVENCKIAGLGHLMDYDDSLRKLTEFPVGHEAWHDQNDNWVLTPVSLEGKPS